MSLVRLAFCAPAIVLVAFQAACQKVPLLAPNGSTLTITAGTTVLPFNGTTKLTAQVIEASGTPPHSGTHVIFTTTLGSIEPADAETDVNGRVVATFNAGTGSGIAVITAQSGGASASGNNAIRIAIGAAAVGTVQASANPATVSSSGGTTTISAKVLDSTGNVLPNVPVTFSTDNGNLSTGVANTDANGVAQVTLTTNRTAKVTATAGISTTSGTTTTAAPSSSVTVNVNLPAAVTVGAPTPSAPVVGQTVQFPLTYNTTNASPIARIVVDWGDGSVDSLSGAPTGISHIFRSPGGYLVRVTAIDTFGDASNGSASVTVANKPAIVVTISASPNPTVGTVTTFTIAATPTTGNAITSVSVDFGDGTPVTSLPGNTASVQHTYTSPGEYRVTAIVNDSGGSQGSAGTQIIVSPQPPLGVSIQTSQATSGGVTTVTMTANVTPAGTGITKYEWDFGDGTGATTSGNTTSRAYTMSGTKTIKVTITAVNNQMATAQTQVVIP